MIVLEGVTADVCVQLPGDVVYEGVVIPQAVHVVSIDESNFKEGLISEGDALHIVEPCLNPQSVRRNASHIVSDMSQNTMCEAGRYITSPSQN